MPERFVSGETTTKFDETVPTEVINKMGEVSSKLIGITDEYVEFKRINDDEHMKLAQSIDNAVGYLTDKFDTKLYHAMMQTLAVLIPIMMVLEALMKTPIMRAINHFAKWYRYDPKTKHVYLNQCQRVIIEANANKEFDLTDWINQNKDIEC